jgi:hypothetical protein
MLTTFKNFMQDKRVTDMYITGRAGTGKTTGLAKLIEELGDTKCVVCAFTHKACGVLRSKLPVDTRVQTLHSFMKKRPSINDDALNHKHIEVSRLQGRADAVKVVFVDEYSQVGEQDLMDLRDAQDIHNFKVVWIGDPNQLPPVGDAFTIKPHGPYQVTLTKVHRQAGDNPLLNVLDQLILAISGTPVSSLEESDSFIRRQDIVEWYNNDRMSDSFDGVILAYTNQKVEELNAEAQGYEEPKKGDRLYSPTTKEWYTFEEWQEYPACIDRHFGDPLPLGSKYLTLEFLVKEGYRFAKVYDEDGEELVYACVFGHYKYKQALDGLKKAAAGSNAAIGKDAAEWARENKGAAKALTRAKAWRSFLSFNEAVICLDFAHAMTVHKSQGSTYKSVYLDTEDLGIAASMNYTMYLKLMYVATSRASEFVITN